MRRVLVGSAVGVAGSLGLGAAMLPFRSHMSVATAALVLVVPVVVGVVIGGFSAGVVSVLAGFLVYDFAFVPPYQTLGVGNTQDWVALAVYAVVMLLVARVVTGLVAAREMRARGHDVMAQTPFVGIGTVKVDVVELEALPPLVRRRITAQIDDHVKYLAAGAANELGDPGPDLKVHPP